MNIRKVQHMDNYVVDALSRATFTVMQGSWIMMQWPLATRMTQRLELSAEPFQGSSRKTFHLETRVPHFSVMFLIATPYQLFQLGEDVKFSIISMSPPILYAYHKKVHGERVHLEWFTETGDICIKACII